MPIGSGRATRISSTSKDTGALDIEGSRVSGFGLNNIYKGSDTTTVLGALRAKTICATLRNKIILTRTPMLCCLACGLYGAGPNGDVEFDCARREDSPFSEILLSHLASFTDVCSGFGTLGSWLS